MVPGFVTLAVNVQYLLGTVQLCLNTTASPKVFHSMILELSAVLAQSYLASKGLCLKRCEPFWTLIGDPPTQEYDLCLLWHMGIRRSSVWFTRLRASHMEQNERGR